MSMAKIILGSVVLAAMVVACSLPSCEGVVLAGVLAQPEGHGDVPEPVIDDATRATKIDEAVMQKHLGQFWGAVRVARDGKVVLAKGYVLENNGLRPIDAETVMDIGSIAKQFTSAAILKLEMDGKLLIDDAVSKWFPKLGEEAEAVAARVTIQQLMSHTSGQPAEGTIQPLAFPDRDEALRRFFQAKPFAQPGEEFQYCNAGYVVLAAIVERASGQEFAEYVRSAIFKPAGLVGTGFLDGVGVDVPRGAARVVSRGMPTPSRLGILQDGWGWGFKGCGGVLTTMNDLVKWDRALAGESVLNAAAKAKLFAVVRDSSALGWMIDTVGDGRTRQYHTGGTRGFRAAFSRVPAKTDGEGGWVFAVMTNEQNDPMEIERLMLDEVFSGSKASSRSVLHVGGLKFNKHKVANFETGVGVRIGAPGANRERTLTIVHAEPEQTKTLATIGLSQSGAAQLKNDLQRAIKAWSAGDGGDGKSGVSGVIATMPYTERNEQVELPESIKLVVMPRYVGMSEDGKRVVDERVTLVVMDRDAGFWPVIVKMDIKAARELERGFNE